MPTYIITAHIAFPTKQHPIKSGQIRLEIPADSESEARSKCRAFIEGKWRVEIDSCENKERKQQTEDMLSGLGPEFAKMFGDVFGKSK
jgi:hypothetical protein